jgi:hypothetical protein
MASAQKPNEAAPPASVAGLLAPAFCHGHGKPSTLNMGRKDILRELMGDFRPLIAS